MSITVVGKSAAAGKAAIRPYPGGTELDSQLFSWSAYPRGRGKPLIAQNTNHADALNASLCIATLLACRCPLKGYIVRD